ncbi:MAG: tRNA (adenosine(37)-N6)-dimethylallyltransferase MiaA [Flavobacteriaceae bacterium]|nr:tRNA (adenosine(37)-N6)-dimethylallyltransferase MiaA [Flavobacteriaceae bacterium]
MSLEKNKNLISVVGPTAIGKTALAVKLAKHFDTEIISGDSRQFYKEMSIGTAVPTKEELSQAKHHFIQHKSITEDYNVGMFERDAIECIQTLFKTRDIVIMVGGSGLYIKAITEGLDDFPEVDPSIRENLNTKYSLEGLSSLQEQLNFLDPIAYKTIAIDNPHRIIRALEVCLGTGLPYSSFLGKKKETRNFRTISIGLTAERDVIYEIINKRVDIMMEEGLLDETKYLKDYRHLNAMNTVGYKELFNYLDGQCTLEFAISEIKKNTRRFAKRQLTWFKKQEDIIWFDHITPVEEIINKIETQIVEK